MIEIKVTKKEYRDLLDLVYLGEWMINAFRTDDTIQKYEDVEQRIYAYAREAGLEKLIEFDKSFNKFFPTKKFEMDSDVDEYIDEYKNENFWDEIAYRLARRDFIREYGEGAIKKMSWKERIEKEQPFIEKYEEEFEKNGLENLKIGEYFFRIAKGAGAER